MIRQTVLVLAGLALVLAGCGRSNPNDGGWVIKEETKLRVERPATKISKGIGATDDQLGIHVDVDVSDGDLSGGVEVTGTVKNLTNGQFVNRGPMSTGVLMDMGPTAVLDTGKVEIVVISRQQEPNDLECFASQGIDPAKKRYLMLKSRVHWRAGFGDLARATVECAGVGVCTSDYSVLDFRKVRRPIFPLDPI